MKKLIIISALFLVGCCRFELAINNGDGTVSGKKIPVKVDATVPAEALQ